MSYHLSANEVKELAAARLLCPADNLNATDDGNWVPFYTKFSQILSAHLTDSSLTALDLQDIKNAKLWLDVAIGANGGTGMHSVFIRTYTNREGQLRLNREFTAKEMQKASNGVALNLWKNLSNIDGEYFQQVPPINVIAREDASAIGKYLFQGELPDEGDTAIAANAAWSGALGFNLLGGVAPYESWRLLTGGDPSQTTSSSLNTLDDVKNILFAVSAYKEALWQGWLAAGGDIAALISSGIVPGLYPSFKSHVAQYNIASASDEYMGGFKSEVQHPGLQ
jgi:hypothetical protein